VAEFLSFNILLGATLIQQFSHFFEQLPNLFTTTPKKHTVNDSMVHCFDAFFFVEEMTQELGWLWLVLVRAGSHHTLTVATIGHKKGSGQNWLNRPEHRFCPVGMQGIQQKIAFLLQIMH